MERTNRMGTLSLQATDRADVFAVLDVYEDGRAQPSDEDMIDLDDPQFDSGDAWVTGHVPDFTPVSVDGDTGTVRAWFRGDQYLSPSTIVVYIEYEEAEERITEDTANENDSNDALKQRNIIL